MKKMLLIVVLTLLSAFVFAQERIAVPANMVLVEGGTFQMGTDSGKERNERPVHTVTVKSFYIGKYEVTQKEWYEIMGTTLRQQREMAIKNAYYNVYIIEGNNYPMYIMNWYEAAEYCNKLSQKEGLTPAYTIDKTLSDPNNKSPSAPNKDKDNSYDDVRWLVTWNQNANGYRLPTEAEWEFAAKGGTRDPKTIYSGSNSVGYVAWYKENTNGSGMKPVGRKAANSLGIHDMSGNVWEWCWDWYGDYSSEAQTNPVGPDTGVYRVIRGGSWVNEAALIRSANRGSVIPSLRGNGLGFRVVRNAN
ncbi:MAG: formylglycine-generating enzyme family protein [Treponema sp.]|jgi:formylglycine-generating enzyme required for sulfatase activity|nr:formylglycine-generating enzyme family protein [Treponema sp.]